MFKKEVNLDLFDKIFKEFNKSGEFHYRSDVREDGVFFDFDKSYSSFNKEDMFNLSKLLVKNFSDNEFEFEKIDEDVYQCTAFRILYQDNKVYLLDYNGNPDPNFECPKCSYHTFGNDVCRMILENDGEANEDITDLSFRIDLEDEEQSSLMSKIITDLGGIVDNDNEVDYILSDECDEDNSISISDFFEMFYIEIENLYEFSKLISCDEVKPIIPQFNDPTDIDEVFCPNCGELIGADVLEYVIPSVEFIDLKYNSINKYSVDNLSNDILFVKRKQITNKIDEDYFNEFMHGYYEWKKNNPDSNDFPCENEDKLKLEIGDKVIHSVFGKGTVLKIKDEVATIVFLKYSIKNIIIDETYLTKIKK